MRRAVHFVGFGRDLQLLERAARVWGQPDFVHYHNDLRVQFADAGPNDDVYVYARGSENRVHEHAYNDSEVQ